MNKETVLQTQPLLLNVSQVAKMLGLSRTMVYALIALRAYRLCALVGLFGCLLHHCNVG